MCCCFVCVLQDVGAEGINIQNLRLEGSAAASRSGLQLFKPPPLPASAAAEGNAQRGLRGRGVGAAAAAAGPGVPIVRAVDVYLSVHVDGMPQQVGLGL
jgi:hypothetical protein